jgi:hypothetical protein
MQSVVDKVKNTVVSALKGTGEVVNAVTETAASSVVTILKGTGRRRQRRDPGDIASRR